MSKIIKIAKIIKLNNFSTYMQVNCVYNLEKNVNFFLYMCVFTITLTYKICKTTAKNK